MGEPGRQRVVAANYKSTRSVITHQMTQHRAAVRDDVEMKLRQVSRGRPWNCLFALRDQAITHVQPAQQRRERTAGVIQHDLEPRMTFEHPTVYQKRSCQ